MKELEPASLDVMVPSMLLQPLVENSIKHGLASKIEGGSIFLRSRLTNSQLIIEVEDDGVGMGAANFLEKPTGLGGTGIGMANVAERLKVLYGETARMTIDSHEGKGTLIRLRLPVLESEGSIPARSTKNAPAHAGRILHIAGRSSTNKTWTAPPRGKPSPFPAGDRRRLAIRWRIST